MLLEGLLGKLDLPICSWVTLGKLEGSRISELGGSVGSHLPHITQIASWRDGAKIQGHGGV